MHCELGTVLTSNEAGNVLPCSDEMRSCNRCCSGKAVSITRSECVFVALGIQHEMRKRHIVIRGLARIYNISPLYFINGTVKGEKCYVF
jgi:hypothetical protein